MTENDARNNTGLVHYTFTPSFAAGFRVDHDRNTDTTFQGVQANYLVKRWNNRHSQGNFYVRGGVGVRDGDKLNGFTGIQGDWETRRVMLMYDNTAWVAGDSDIREFRQRLGGGVAPYVAEFGSTHTWAMVHIAHEPQMNKNWQLEPMIRVFRGVTLVEFGYNVTTRTPILNGFVRF